MKKVVSALAGLVVIGLACLVAAFVFGEVVYPGEVGVRQIKLEPFQGFSARGLPSGYHWSVPFFSTIHRVPTTLQVMHMQRPGGEQAEEITEKGGARITNALEVQTTDGSKVVIDLSVLYRYYENPSDDFDPAAAAASGGHDRQSVDGDTSGDEDREPAASDTPPDTKRSDTGTLPGKPLPGAIESATHAGVRELITQIGLRPEQWQDRVHNAVENELQRALGELSTSQFYNPKRREAALGFGKREVNRRLRRFGIEVEELLLRRYTYAEARIDRAIFEKNLQEQEELLNAAASRLESARASTEEVAAKMDASIKTKRIEGETKAEIARSEGQLYEARKRAEADLAVAQSQAEVERLRAEALSKGLGSDMFVAKELTPLLSALRGGVVSAVDPFNLDQWVKLLSGAPTVLPGPAGGNQNPRGLNSRTTSSAPNVTASATPTSQTVDAPLQAESPGAPGQGPPEQGRPPGENGKNAAGNAVGNE